MSRDGTGATTPGPRWVAGEPLVVQSYREIAALGRRGRQAVIDGNLGALGHLMNENHALVAALGGSGEANDRLICAAREAGAYGAKLAGAGGGGTILALCEYTDRVTAALRQAGAVSVTTPAPVPGLTVVEE